LEGEFFVIAVDDAAATDGVKHLPVYDPHLVAVMFLDVEDSVLVSGWCSAAP
jgi:hypothetical protein